MLQILPSFALYTKAQQDNIIIHLHPFFKCWTLDFFPSFIFQTPYCPVNDVSLWSKVSWFYSFWFILFLSCEFLSDRPNLRPVHCSEVRYLIYQSSKVECTHNQTFLGKTSGYSSLNTFNLRDFTSLQLLVNLVLQLCVWQKTRSCLSSIQTDRL